MVLLADAGQKASSWLSGGVFRSVWTCGVGVPEGDSPLEEEEEKEEEDFISASKLHTSLEDTHFLAIDATKIQSYALALQLADPTLPQPL